MMNDVKINKDTATKWLNLLPIEYRVHINSSLIKKQGLDRTDVGIIFDLHGQKIALFDEARDLIQECAVIGKITEANKERILAINKILEKLEFTAQQTWKFSEDSKFHNWWLDIPGCSCPQMDNRDRLGYGGLIYSGTCPWHGWFDEKKEI